MVLPKHKVENYYIKYIYNESLKINGKSKKNFSEGLSKLLRYAKLLRLSKLLLKRLFFIIRLFSARSRSTNPNIQKYDFRGPRN